MFNNQKKQKGERMKKIFESMMENSEVWRLYIAELMN